MKLKKLAAGACALALGAAMMAMPASAETFSSTNSASQDVTATGTTTHSYAVDLTWDHFQFGYTRKWNPATLQYDYTSNNWETAEGPNVTVTNRSDVTIQASVAGSTVDGVTIEYSMGGSSVKKDLKPIFEGQNSEQFFFLFRVFPVRLLDRMVTLLNSVPSPLILPSLRTDLL